MSKVIAVLPVGGDRAARAASAGRRRRLHQRRLCRARRSEDPGRPAGSVPAAADGRRLGRALRVSRHADAVDGDRDPRLDRDRRQRRAGRLPQARRHEFAWRQCRGDRGDCARAAHALADARDQRVVAPTRLSRRPVLGARDGARRSRRRRRDVADARLPARDRAHGSGARFRERGRSDGARLRAPARQAAARLRLDGERPQPRGRGRRSATRRAPTRARPRRITASSASSRCCATSTAFDLARLAPGPLGPTR